MCPCIRQGLTRSRLEFRGTLDAAQALFGRQHTSPTEEFFFPACIKRSFKKKTKKKQRGRMHQTKSISRIRDLLAAQGSRQRCRCTSTLPRAELQLLPRSRPHAATRTNELEVKIKGRGARSSSLSQDFERVSCRMLSQHTM